jgi:hypothetical protein
VKINITYPDGHSTNTTANAIPAGWQTLRYDDFETGTGWGINSYTDGSTDNDCQRIYNSSLAHHGYYSIRIRSYNGLNSSFYLTNGIVGKTNQYSQLKVDFWFIAKSMDDCENFWVKYWDGTHWLLADTYIKPGIQGNLPSEKPFGNDIFYHAISWINSTKFPFHDNMKIRFQCDASDVDDQIYIDQVYINATTGQPVTYYKNTIFNNPGTYHYYIWAQDNHGNSIRSGVRTFGIGSPYTLTTHTNGTGTGTIIVRPLGPYYYGDIITLWANASINSTFIRWYGNLSGTTTPQTLTMNGNKTVTARFTKKGPYTLTMASNGTGSGTVQASPSGPYYYGTIVTLWANASEGSAFTGWSGNLSGYDNPAILMMDANKTVNAEFTLNGYNDIVFNSSFEMGNLIHIQFQNGDASGYRSYTATLNYSMVSYSDKHWWFYFSMEHTAGKTITIQLQNLAPADFQPGDLSRWGNIEPVYSYNNTDWERLPLGNVSADPVAYTFTMTITPTQNKVWLAPIPPYTTKLRDALFTEYTTSPYLNVTSLGTTPGNQPLKIATITDPTIINETKYRIYIIAQQHAGEIPSSWLIEGMIRFLLNTSDPTAAALRRSYIFKIIPIVNVDGVYYGEGRYTPLRAGVQYDLNREWDKAVGSMQPEIRWIYQDIQSWLPNAFIDMHSTVNVEGVGSSRDCMFLAPTLTDSNLNTFMDRIATYWPESCARSTTGYACYQVRLRLGVQLSTSMEHPDDELRTMIPLRKLTTTDWKNWGEAATRGIYLYFGDSHPWLVDSDFNASTNSAELRTDGLGQDWYESRGGFTGGDPTLLTLDTNTIGGNNGKKAALKNYGIASNAFLTQEFFTTIPRTFTVSYNINIDRIQDNANYDRTGHLFIGDNRVTTDAPTGSDTERYVCLAFYDPTPGDTGNDIQLRARTLSTQAWATTSQWIQVTTGLSYDTWYTIKLVVKIPSSTYDIYINGQLKMANIPKYNLYTPTVVQYLTFAADSDARGDYYIDNVYSPTSS